jgi:hypothetical protein
VHSSGADFLSLLDQIDLPDFVVSLEVSNETVEQRWSKANEDGEVGEEQKEEFKQQVVADKKAKEQFSAKYQALESRINLVSLSTDSSLETTLNELNSKFSPKVILVNHEKRLGVDVTCSNLAIKYNLLYISVYQLIMTHIQGGTAWGHKLLASKREKDIQINS